MTAPTLPGAAPAPAPGRNDPARLPEDVERALQAAASAQVAFGIDVSAENATTTINAWQALRAAIAAHVAPGGDPVAYGYMVIGADYRREFVRFNDDMDDTECESARESADLVCWAMNESEFSRSKPYRVVPLCTHPTAHVAPPVSASFDATHLRPKPGVKPESAGCGGAPRAPDSPSFEESLTGLDVENDYAPDRGTTYAIVGLDDVRAAHRAEVDAAVRAEREACARVVEKAYIDRPAYNGGDSPEWVSSNETRRVAAAIRARGAKS